jgi:hypothetical protein
MREGVHTETPEQYQARLNSYVADKDPKCNEQRQMRLPN